MMDEMPTYNLKTCCEDGCCELPYSPRAKRCRKHDIQIKRSKPARKKRVELPMFSIDEAREQQRLDREQGIALG